MKIQYSATLLSIMIASSSCTLFPGSANEPNDPNSPNDSGSTSSAIVQVDSTGSNTGTDTGTNTSTTSSAFVANTAVATSTATQTAMSESTDGGLPTVVVVTVVVTVNLEDAGVSVALAPNADPPADPPADPDAGTVDPTPDTGTVLPEASTPVADSGMADSNSPETSTVVFADTIPDSGTTESVPQSTACCTDPSGCPSLLEDGGLTNSEDGGVIQLTDDGGLTTFISFAACGSCIISPEPPFTGGSSSGACCIPNNPGNIFGKCGIYTVPSNVAIGGSCCQDYPYSFDSCNSISFLNWGVCATGLRCVSEVCQAPSELGGVCNTIPGGSVLGAICAEGLTCFGAIGNTIGEGTPSICITPLPLGSTCMVNSDCESDNCPGAVAPGLFSNVVLTCQPVFPSIP